LKKPISQEIVQKNEEKLNNNKEVQGEKTVSPQETKENAIKNEEKSTQETKENTHKNEEKLNNNFKKKNSSINVNNEQPKHDSDKQVKPEILEENKKEDIEPENKFGLSKETEFYSNTSYQKDEILRKVSLENDKQNLPLPEKIEKEGKLPESNETNKNDNINIPDSNLYLKNENTNTPSKPGIYDHKQPKDTPHSQKKK